MAEPAIGRRNDLHPLLWLGLPVASVAVCWLTPLLGYARWHRVMTQENSLIEQATVLVLLPAIAISVLIFLRRRQLPRYVGVLMLAGGLAALYFAGEEISWGQHWGLTSLEELAQDNPDGKQFGLHFRSNFFNNLPRQLMMVACVVGGVILPVALRKRLRRPGADRGFWYWAIPTCTLIPAALLAASCKLPNKIYRELLIPTYQVPPDHYAYMAFVHPAGEFKEYCYGLVMLLYLLSVYVRLRSGGPELGAEPG